MTSEHEETDAEFEAFIAGVDAALARKFGPNHQEALSAGRMVHQFKWGGAPKRIDPG